MEENLTMTLKAARVNKGLTILEACKLLGFGKDTLIKYEKHPELIKKAKRAKLSEVYAIAEEHIFFGNK